MKKIYSNATIEFVAIKAENILLYSLETASFDDNTVQKIDFSTWN